MTLGVIDSDANVDSAVHRMRWRVLSTNMPGRPQMSYKSMTAAMDCPTLSAAASISRSPR